VERPLQLLVVSAKTAVGLREQAKKYAGHLEKHGEESLADVLSHGRKWTEPFRGAVGGGVVIVGGGEAKLEGFAGGEVPVGCVVGRLEESRRPKVGFFVYRAGVAIRGYGEGAVRDAAGCIGRRWSGVQRF